MPFAAVTGSIIVSKTVVIPASYKICGILYCIAVTTAYGIYQ